MTKVRTSILMASLLLFAGGCGSEMTPQDAAQDAAMEVCVCVANANSKEEMGPCMDESSPPMVVIAAYAEKLKAEGMTKEEMSQDPVSAQVMGCVMGSAFKNIE